MAPRCQTPCRRGRCAAAAASLLAAGLLTAGCGADEAPRAPAGTTPATRPAAVEVAMRDIRFRPHRVVVRLGQSVRWTNEDEVAHTVAAPRLRLASEAIRAGATFTYRPRRRGTFGYVCTIHAGQTGVLVVR